MANYFYTDANGQKQGPINDEQLRTLAARGVVTPDTPLETDSGYKGVAGQIPGLDFNNTVNTSPKQRGTGTQDTYARKASALANKARFCPTNVKFLFSAGCESLRS